MDSRENDTDLGCWNETLNSSVPGCNRTLPEWFAPLEQAHRIILTFILVYTMLAMGCTVEISVVIKHLKRPWAILVGSFCQFFLLPALAFGMVHALQLEALYALGVVFVACSPGGGTSNLFTYWVDGDVTLSIVMTAVSTILAFGLMPLNIFIYTRLWTEALSTTALKKSPFAVIPYDKLFITLASTVGPVIVGILIRRKFLKLANILATVGSILGLLCIATVITMQTFLYGWHKQRTWQLWVAAMVLPAIGYSSGFVCSLLLCQKGLIPRTVAIETGCQNVALALSVIALSFPTHIVKKVIIFPTLFGVFMLLVAFVPIGIYRIYRCIVPMVSVSFDDDITFHDNNGFCSTEKATKNGYLEHVTHM